MSYSPPVSDIMSKSIVALKRSDDLERADMLFNKYRIKHIPVVSSDVVVGMLSYADLLKISTAETGNDHKAIHVSVKNNFSIEQVMSKDIVTISSNTTIRKAASILAKREFHALPVVDEGILVGIVTTRDLLNFFSSQY